MGRKVQHKGEALKNLYYRPFLDYTLACLSFFNEYFKYSGETYVFFCRFAFLGFASEAAEKAMKAHQNMKVLKKPLEVQFSKVQQKPGHVKGV